MKTFLGFPVIMSDEPLEKGNWTLRGVTPAEAEKMARRVVGEKTWAEVQAEHDNHPITFQWNMLEDPK